MSIKTAIRKHLLDRAAISTIVGTKIRFNRADQEDALPYIIITKDGKNPVHHMGGATGLAMPTFTLTCWDNGSIKAETLADEVRDTLDGFQGTLGTSPNDAEVGMCHLVNDFDLDEQRFGDNINAHGVALEFEFAHRETVPSL